MNAQQRHDAISQKLARDQDMPYYEQEHLKQTLHYLEVELGARAHKHKQPNTRTRSKHTPKSNTKQA